jgi:ATP-dependent RNA helicase RhlE
VSLVCVDELQLLKDIEKLIKRAVPQEVIAGFEPDPNAKPEPILRRGQGGGGGGGRQPRQGQGAPKRDGGSAKPAQRSGQRPAGGQQQAKPQGARPAGAPTQPQVRKDNPRHETTRHHGKPGPATHDGAGATHAPRKPQGQGKPQGGNPGTLLGGAKPRNDAPRSSSPRNGQRGR